MFGDVGFNAISFIVAFMLSFAFIKNRIVYVLLSSSAYILAMANFASERLLKVPINLFTLSRVNADYFILAPSVDAELFYKILSFTIIFALAEVFICKYRDVILDKIINAPRNFGGVHKFG